MQRHIAQVLCSAITAVQYSCQLSGLHSFLAALELLSLGHLPHSPHTLQYAFTTLVLSSHQSSLSLVLSWFYMNRFSVRVFQKATGEEAETEEQPLLPVVRERIVLHREEAVHWKAFGVRVHVVKNMEYQFLVIL